MRPTPWASVRSEDLAQVRGVCLDIDDTLSTSGKLTAEAFSALWALKSAGFFVVPITGRPAGWCDQIARFWPVDAVVGENGAFTFFMDKGVRRRIDTPAGDSRDALQAKLLALRDAISGRFPQAVFASDQAYREYDLAIDICEDVPPWPEGEVEALLAFCQGRGAHAKLSSIHVNTWFGNYDKRTGFAHWLAQGAPGIAPGVGVPTWDQWLFIGDSPNDEPLFEAFSFSVGVANLLRYLGRLKSPPRWITAGASGAGFSEMVKTLARTG